MCVFEGRRSVDVCETRLVASEVDWKHRGTADGLLWPQTKETVEMRLGLLDDLKKIMYF